MDLGLLVRVGMDLGLLVRVGIESGVLGTRGGQEDGRGGSSPVFS